MQKLELQDDGLDGAKSERHRLTTEIQLYEKESGAWVTKSKKILRRYKDERTPRDGDPSRYNILWSNVQTMAPALYARNPKPDVERRFKDNDALSRVASDILERDVSYFVSTDLFSQTMKQVVLDRLLSGRGTAWVRYIPHFQDVKISGNEEERDEGFQVTDDADEESVVQEVTYEEVVPDYVHWEDFGHNIARTWEEVYLVWRKAYLTRDELVERFGEEVGNAVPLDYTPKGLNDEKVATQFKKATVYEMWDKNVKKAFWVHKDYDGLLDEKDDPLGLVDFFPCPRPLLATTANDSLIPVPDYVEYQDQAIELDELTSRIAAIKKSLKVAGVYDASAQGLERLLAEGVENQLIPVEQWAILGEKGGLKGVMSLLPMEEIANTLLALYQAREATKSDLYEITGMSDVMRGNTNPDETATAQQLKGQYTNIRLNAHQGEVQRFARDLVRIMAQIIAEHFTLETIKQISGIKLLTSQEKQALQMQIQQQAAIASQQGQQAQKPDDDVREMLENPTWEEVDALLKNDALRCFRIDIETDSTIKADEDAEKANRVEFLNAAGQFLKGAVEVGGQQPELIPLLGEMLRFGMQAFRVGKPLEGAFNLAISDMERKAKDASNQPPQPDPEVLKAQQEAQIEQGKLAVQKETEGAKVMLEKAKAEADISIKAKELEIKERELALKERELEMTYSMKIAEMQNGQELEDKKIKIDLAKHRMSEVAAMEDGEFEEDGEVRRVSSAIGDALNQMAASNQMIAQIVASHSQLLSELQKSTASAKRVVRDGAGKIVGVEVAQ